MEQVVGTDRSVQRFKSLQESCVLIVGLGLIGGSLAKALKDAKCCAAVLGYTRSAESLQAALRDEAIDQGFDCLTDAVKAADIVVLCTPLSTYEALLTEIKPFVQHQILTDVGSVKACVLEVARTVFGSVPTTFVPGHPIAGSEKSGLVAAQSNLYRSHYVILTPLEQTDEQALTLVQGLWEEVGAQVSCMGFEQHDSILANTSHLPHLVAFSLVDTLARRPDSDQVFQYAAGGFRDFTRIAASDALMWRDIFKANRMALLESLNDFKEDLTALEAAIAADDQVQVMAVLKRAKQVRSAFTQSLLVRGQHAHGSPLNPARLDFYCEPADEISGQVQVPGDKSISHRAIMFGALAEGLTQVQGFLEGEDCLATMSAFQKMGVSITRSAPGAVTIKGVGIKGLQAPGVPLDVGNSGTSMRLLLGLLAAQSFDTVLIGDESLSQRPMTRVTEPLTAMGGCFETTKAGTAPVKILASSSLSAIDYQLPMASAQVKSAVLLAGLYAQGETQVTEPASTRDHTERMMQAFGVQLKRTEQTVSVEGGAVLRATDLQVPADISSAAFFMVAAALASRGELQLKQVGVNPTRTGVLHILRRMGANITLSNERLFGTEPVADIIVRPSVLRGIHIPVEWVPLAIDEFPVIFVAAACCEGETVLTGARELRVKESDRIQVMADGLQRLGVEAVPTPEGMRIQGRAHLSEAVFSGGVVESHGDHRIAMAFAVASVRAKAPIMIRDCANVATSFPNFTELAGQIGLHMRKQSCKVAQAK